MKALAGYLPPEATHDFDVNHIVRENVRSNRGAKVVENSSANEKAKYSDFLHLPHGLDGYFELDQAMSIAKIKNKPLFIDFTGHGCVNCREMEANVWSDPAVLDLLENEFVVVALYVDDKTTLPENEWIKSSYDGKVKKTLGKKMSTIKSNDLM